MAGTERLRVNITLPQSLHDPQASSILETNGVLVIVGPNGAGKTRFGVWLENSGGAQTHRISAQKSLEFPVDINLTNLEQAENRLLTGGPQASPANRSAYRWGSRPETFSLNDYQLLTQYLFSEEQEQSTAYRKMMQSASQYQRPPETKLDVIKRIWESVIPTHELKIGGLRVEVSRRSAFT